MTLIEPNVPLALEGAVVRVVREGDALMPEVWMGPDGGWHREGAPLWSDILRGAKPASPALLRAVGLEASGTD